MTKLAVPRPGDPSTRLNTERRDRELRQLAEAGSVDVLIVGAGVTGLGVALDAVSRGLEVAVVDRGDLAAGTSAWSSKLLHGGLRYLAKGDLGVAWESARERHIVSSTMAPHLVRPMTQVVPIYRGELTNGALARLGYLGGDVLKGLARTRRRNLPGTSLVGIEAATAQVPKLKTTDLVGAVVGHDYQLSDDVRLVVALARTAAAYGARILTRVSAVDLDGPAGAVVLDDLVTGQRFDLRARRVVNATGVWAGELDPRVALTPSRGTHLVLPSAAFGDSSASLTVPVPEHFGRFVFTLPQLDGTTYLGLTDEPESGSAPQRGVAPMEDQTWLLSVLNGFLDEPLDPKDVLGSFVGYRPLISDGSGDGPGDRNSADLSRRHAVVDDGRLLTITGGKLTAFRAMAAEAVDLLTDRPCQSANLALVGAGRHSTVAGIPQHLLSRYGDEAALVWQLALAHPALAQPVAEPNPTIGAELLFGLQWEAALTPEDLILRRTRLGLSRVTAARSQDFAERIVADQEQGEPLTA